MHGRDPTPDLVRLRSQSCQRQRQRLLRAAVENSTQRVHQLPLAALHSLWRQQAALGGSADFERFARRVARSRSRQRQQQQQGGEAPVCGGGGRQRSASEPRGRAPTASRHSPPVLVPVVPVVISGPYVCVAASPSPPVHGNTKADQTRRTARTGSRETQQDPYGSGVPPVCVVAVPMVVCAVGMSGEQQWAAARRQGRGSVAAVDSASQADNASQKGAQPPRRSSLGDLQLAKTRRSRSRTRTLPGNFAELQKAWASNTGSHITVPSRNIRL